MKVLIAGAGIAGLALAAALRDRAQVVVLERRAELGSGGAGLLLQANGMRAVQHLGIEGPVAQAGAAVRTGRGVRSDGRALSELDLARIAAHLGVEPIALRRDRLHELLRTAAHDVELLRGACVVQISQTDASVTAELETGERITGDVLVGADGLFSTVRRSLLDDDPPRYAGYTSFRGIAQSGAACPSACLTEIWGRGLRFGMVGIGSGETYWFAVTNAPEREPGEHRWAQVSEQLRGWAMRVAELLDSTPDASVIRTDIYDRDPIPRWCYGRVALMGDAAHPATPDLGQGASLALEDAVVLARALRNAPNHTVAFAEYEHARVSRAERVVLESRSYGRIAQVENPLLIWIRDLAFRVTPRRTVEARTRSLVDFDCLNT